MRKEFHTAQRGDLFVCTGTDFLGTVTVPASEARLIGSEAWGMYVGIEALKNTRLGAFGTLYERYRIKRFDIHFAGAQPATAQDSLLGYYDADPSDYNPAGDDAIHCAMATTNSGIFKSWESSRLSIPAHRMDKWLYTNQPQDVPSGTAIDQRLYEAGYAALIHVTPLTAPATGLNLVTVWVSFVVEFDIPQLQRNAPAVNMFGGTQTYGPSAVELVPNLGNAIASALSRNTFDILKNDEERVGEAKLQKTGTVGVRVPAGLYEVIMQYGVTGTNASVSSAENDLSLHRYAFDVTATPVAGGSSPINATWTTAIQNIAPGLLNTWKQANAAWRSVVDLKADAVLDMLVSSDVSQPLRAVIGSGTGVLTTLFTIKKLQNLLHTGKAGAFPTLAAANFAAEPRLATNGKAYALLSFELPEGWWWCDESGRALSSPGARRSRVAVAGPAEEPDVDEQECEVLSQASSARGYQLAAPVVVRAPVPARR